MIGLILLVLSFSRSASAIELESDQISLNNVPMNNVFVIGKSSFMNTLAANYERYADTNEFIISLQGDSPSKSKAIAETEFIQKLGVTRNEACFLDVSVVAPRNVFGDTTDSIDPNLSFCSSPAQQDLNEDEVVNGFDFAQCFVDAEVADEAERAFDAMPGRGTFAISTGQTMESLYELDLPCDFNVNRRIDALDISKMIQVMTESK